MNWKGPIIVIEDDADDQELFAAAFKNLGYTNLLHFFSDGQQALHFLNTSGITPFLIVSDIELPKLDGFALKSKIKMDESLHLKCIPYIFFSSALNQKAVVDAYSMFVQGFFLKQNTIAELEKTISVIMEYWQRCASPYNFH